MTRRARLVLFGGLWMGLTSAAGFLYLGLDRFPGSPTETALEIMAMFLCMMILVLLRRTD